MQEMPIQLSPHQVGPPDHLQPRVVKRNFLTSPDLPPMVLLQAPSQPLCSHKCCSEQESMLGGRKD